MNINKNHESLCIQNKPDYEYIGSYSPNEIIISKNKPRPIKTPYVRVKHKYCGTEIDVQSSDFFNNNRIYNCCCGSYEKSFAYHIEVELGEPLEKYWDFEKNTVNPYHIGKGVRQKVWIKCSEKDYHDSKEQDCVDFKNGKRCSYCAGHKTHPKDSFAQYHIDNTDKDFLEKYWDYEKNTVDPFTIARGSDTYVYIKCQEKDYHDSYKIRIANFSHGYRCSYCNVQNEPHPLDSVGNMFKDIADTIVYDHMQNKVDVYKISPKTHNKFYFKCPECGEIGSKPKSLASVVYYKYSCEYCSDGLSIPEKFISNLLKHLGVKYIQQLSKCDFDWCDRYRYDFYIPDFNMIIETHGLQHYKDTPNFNLTLKEQIKIDKHKMNIALSNGIFDYIVIDCRCSELDYLKDKTFSKLGNIFDLSSVEWDNIWTTCQKSKIVESWDLWNSGIKNTSKIGDILNVGSQTIIRYLKIGAKLDKCDYNSLEEMHKGYFKKGHNNKKVILLNTKKVFDNALDASNYIGLKSNSGISACCRHKRNYSGKINGEPAKWMYYEDYLKHQESNAS